MINGDVSDVMMINDDSDVIKINGDDSDVMMINGDDDSDVMMMINDDSDVIMMVHKLNCPGVMDAHRKSSVIEVPLLVSMVHNSCFNNLLDVDGPSCDSDFTVYDFPKVREMQHIQVRFEENNSLVMCCSRGISMLGLYLF